MTRHHRPLSHRPRARSIGFTLVELIMGMSVTAMVMVALSAVCVAIGASWREGEFTRSAWLSGNGTTTQLQRSLRDARYLGYVVTGELSGEPPAPASVFYWRDDDFGGDADGKLQIGEMALIEFDPVARTIARYEAKPWSQMTAAQQLSAGGDASFHLRRSDLVNNPLAGDEFKAYLTSSGVGVTTTIARHVAAAQFTGYRGDGANVAGRPVVQFVLRFERAADATTAGGEPTGAVERGSVTLRASTTRPTNY